MGNYFIFLIAYYYETIGEIISSFCKKIGDSYDSLEFFYKEKKWNEIYNYIFLKVDFFL